MRCSKITLLDHLRQRRRADPALVEKLARNSYAVESSTPDELAKFLKADTKKWEALIKTARIKIE
jgi:tripartite-type tricarboxylate transporter receptor subunit TctC